MSDITRRDALRRLALAVAASGFIDPASARQVHQMTAAAKAADSGTYVPRALSAHDFATLRRLTDLIIPIENGAPGALEAGAAEWIDMLASENPRLKEIYTTGLAWIDSAMKERGAADFLGATPAEQTALLDLVAFRRNRTPALEPGIEFFGWVRRMTVDAFYTSEIGFKDIDYRGNTALPSYPAPTEAITYALKRSGLVVLAALLLAGAPLAQSGSAQTGTYPSYPSETPAQFTPVTDSFDYVRRAVMVPMRDGVKLHTVILVPKGAKGAPILLTRTPYDADRLTTHASSAHLGPILAGYDNATDVILEDGYIRVVQDVRGKYHSEGDYVMNRPLHGPQNPTPVDHATDTFDTIDWLVKNVPESNGRVGILGISYDGFLPLMALVNPHPALKVAVPMNPMVDGWMGDDWFHNGAFRQQMIPYIHDQQATRDSSVKWWSSHFDDYDAYMEAGSAGELARRHGVEQLGFWRKVIAHPSYDAFWRDQAMDKLLATQPLQVPVMLVHSLWDQEDIYGATAVYKALEPKDTNNDKVFLVMGPWHHGQEIGDGSSLGALSFGTDTARHFRQEILRPFLARYLADNPPKADVAPVSAFETGTNTWRRLTSWPSGCTNGCTPSPTPLYLGANLKAGFDAPKNGDAPYDEYVSDPAKPVPFRARPIQPIGYEHGATWSQWLVDDQREASGRPDVLAFVSATLTGPVKITGQPVANLIASTSGTDSDWVVKLIDVYPDELAGQPELGGYQLMVSGDIFRGRYRESLETPKALAAGTPLAYKFALPTANHVFLPGHRIMVQVQSSWFPLYDRNPQTFVENIFWAKPGDFRKAVQRIYHAPGQESFIELPIVKQ